VRTKIQELIGIQIQIWQIAIVAFVAVLIGLTR